MSQSIIPILKWSISGCEISPSQRMSQPPGAAYMIPRTKWPLGWMHPLTPRWPIGPPDRDWDTPGRTRVPPEPYLSHTGQRVTCREIGIFCSQLNKQRITFFRMVNNRVIVAANASPLDKLLRDKILNRNTVLHCIQCVGSDHHLVCINLKGCAF